MSEPRWKVLRRIMLVHWSDVTNATDSGDIDAYDAARVLLEQAARGGVSMPDEVDLNVCAKYVDNYDPTP